MSNVFAFSQAQEAPISFVRGGHYDVEQQLWIADETSYAYEDIAPVEGDVTKKATGEVTGTPTGGDWKVDGTLDF